MEKLLKRTIKRTLSSFFALVMTLSIIGISEAVCIAAETGDTTERLTDRHFKVSNVKSAFDRIATDGTVKQKTSVDFEPAKTHVSHIQGYARYRGEGFDYHVISHSNIGDNYGGYGYMMFLSEEKSHDLVPKHSFIVKMFNPVQKSANDKYFCHPGGVQIIGDYLFTCIIPASGSASPSFHKETMVRVFDLTPLLNNPPSAPTMVTKFNRSFSADYRATGIAVTDVKSNFGTTGAEETNKVKYMTGIFTDHKDKTLNIYLSNAVSGLNELTGIGDFKKSYNFSDNYQTISFLRDAKDVVYMVGYYGSDVGKDWIHVYKLTNDNGTAFIDTPVRINDIHVYTKGNDNVHFRWTGGIEIFPNDNLLVYATGKHFGKYKDTKSNKDRWSATINYFSNYGSDSYKTMPVGLFSASPKDIEEPPNENPEIMNFSDDLLTLSASEVNRLAESHEVSSLIVESANGNILIPKEELVNIAGMVQNSFTLKIEPVTDIEINNAQIPLSFHLQSPAVRIETLIDGKDYQRDGIKAFVNSASGGVLFIEEDVRSMEAVMLDVDYEDFPVENGGQMFSFNVGKNGIYIFTDGELALILRNARTGTELRKALRNAIIERISESSEESEFIKYEDALVNSDKNITVGNMAILLHWYIKNIITGETLNNFAEPDHPDVGHYLKWAYESGLIIGSTAEGPFMEVTENLTKERVVTLFDRLFTMIGIDLPQHNNPELIDISSVSLWAYDSVKRFIDAGILTNSSPGVSNGRYNGQELITFADFMSVLGAFNNRLDIDAENLNIDLNEIGIVPKESLILTSSSISQPAKLRNVNAVFSF